jgi:hypothetical protein
VNRESVGLQVVRSVKTVGHPLHAQEKKPVLLALEAFLNTL